MYLSLDQKFLLFVSVLVFVPVLVGNFAVLYLIFKIYWEEG
tara:strand:- start:2830 stop:2952 length:123 start_codon:yes stop_codon:yes gene_type:complete